MSYYLIFSKCCFIELYILHGWQYISFFSWYDHCHDFTFCDINIPVYKKIKILVLSKWNGCGKILKNNCLKLT